MDDEAIGFTEKQKAVFDAFCGLLTTAKRNELKRQYVKSIDDDIKTVDLTSLEIDGIKVFEAYHIIKFYSETKKIDSAKRHLIREFKVRETKPKSQAEITKIASEKSYSKEATAEIFKILAKARRVELPECFLQFLKFCREKHLPLRVFSSKSDLDSYISELESGLNPSVESFNLSWNKGLLSLTTDPHTFEPTIPNNSAAKNVNNVASILTWDCQLTPLIGRDEELTELHDWAESKAEKSIKIISGAGGVGKTRLAFHFAEQLKGKGWNAGQIAFEHIGVCKVQNKGLALIIDYPEDKIHGVERLLRCLKDLKPVNFKLRILLLSRNENFLKKIAQPISQLLANSLKLKGLDCNGWRLFQCAWEELCSLKRSNIQLQVSSEDFEKWQESNDTHKKPLMIIALAFYLFDEPSKEVYISGLSGREIIRYITLREIYLIKNEAESYSRQLNENVFDYQGLCLLIAASSIANGLNYQEINAACDKLFGFKLDFYPPKAKVIKESSFWVNNRLLPIKPDLLAADFLAYCMEMFAENQEIYWIMSVFSFSQDYLEKDKSSFSKLSRLVYDNDVTLIDTNNYGSVQDDSIWIWPLESLKNGLKDNKIFARWIASHVSSIEASNFSREVIGCSLSLSDTTLSLYDELKQLQSLAILHYERNDKSCLKLGKKALTLSEKLLQEDNDDEEYQSLHALNLLNISNFYMLNSRYQEFHDFSKQAYAMFTSLSQLNPEFAWYDFNRCMCMRNLASSLRFLNRLEEAKVISEKAIQFYSMFDTEKSYDLLSLEYAALLSLNAQIHRELNNEEIASKRLLEAIDISQQLYLKSPDLHEERLTGYLFDLISLKSPDAYPDETFKIIDTLTIIGRKNRLSGSVRLRKIVAYSLNVAALKLIGEGHYDEAEPPLLESQSIFQKLSEESSSYDEKKELYNSYYNSLVLYCHFLIDTERHIEAIACLSKFDNQTAVSRLSEDTYLAIFQLCKLQGTIKSEWQEQYLTLFNNISSNRNRMTTSYSTSISYDATWGDGSYTNYIWNTNVDTKS